MFQVWGQCPRGEKGMSMCPECHPWMSGPPVSGLGMVSLITGRGLGPCHGPPHMATRGDHLPNECGAQAGPEALAEQRDSPSCELQSRKPAKVLPGLADPQLSRDPHPAGLRWEDLSSFHLSFLRPMHKVLVDTARPWARSGVGTVNPWLSGCLPAPHWAWR